jgi:hypothetical protein
MVLVAPLRCYLAGLSAARATLWCYAIWYLINVWNHFDPNPRLWLTSIGLSVIIGFALLLSTTASDSRKITLDRWVIFRLFLMPFCVSSFGALVKDAGYILIFPPSVKENLVGAGFIALFLAIVWMAKAFQPNVRLDSAALSELVPSKTDAAR